MPHGAVECGADARQMAQRRRLPVEYRGQRVHRRLAEERRSARQHFVEHDAKGKDIRARIHEQASRLLGRHVGHRAENLALQGLERAGDIRAHRGVVRDELGQAEVQDLHQPVAPDHHVLGLDVAMDDAERVGGLEPSRRLDHEIDGESRRQRAGAHARAKRLAVDEFGRDEVPPIRFADVINRDDVGMVERRDAPRFPLKAPQTVFVLRKPRRDDLERELAAKPKILGEIHLAHPALAKLAQDSVRTDDFADHRSRPVSRDIDWASSIDRIRQSDAGGRDRLRVYLKNQIAKEGKKEGRKEGKTSGEALVQLLMPALFGWFTRNYELSYPDRTPARRRWSRAAAEERRARADHQAREHGRGPSRTIC